MRMIETSFEFAGLAFSHASRAVARPCELERSFQRFGAGFGELSFRCSSLACSCFV